MDPNRGLGREDRPTPGGHTCPNWVPSHSRLQPAGLDSRISPCNFRGCAFSLTPSPLLLTAVSALDQPLGGRSLRSQVQLPPSPLAAAFTQRHKAWVSGPAGPVLLSSAGEGLLLNNPGLTPLQR